MSAPTSTGRRTSTAAHQRPDTHGFTGPGRLSGAAVRSPGQRRRHVALAVLSTVTIVVATALLNGPDDQEQQASGSGGGLDCSTVTGHASDLEPAQERNAKIITAVAHTRGLGNSAATIAMTAALAESTLYNYANDGASTMVGSLEGRPLTEDERAVARRSMAYPHDRVGDNLDSIGLFQQRPMSGWGPPEVLVDPMRASGRFFDELVEVPQWDSQPAWDIAQAVQGSPSSNGEIYRASYPLAETIVAELTATGSGRPADDAQPIDGGLCTPVD